MQTRNQRARGWLFLPLLLGVFFIYWKRIFWDDMLPCDGDTLRLVYPSWVIVREHLLHFQSLLWDPLRNMGQPLLASPPAEALYPVQWISPFVGFFAYSKIFIAVHTALVLFYGYKLFMLLHGDEVTAWFGAIALAFNGLMLDKAAVHCDLAAMCWIPACFYYLCARRTVQLGFCLALQWLAGLPTYSILTGAMMTVYALVCDEPAPVMHVLLRGGLVGAGLSAIQWIPFLECLHLSQRGTLLAAGMATEYSLSPLELMRGLAFPSFAMSGTPAASSSDPAVAGFFLGPFLSALFALGVWRAAKTTQRIALLTVVAFALALGSHLYFYDRIPFITIFRFPALWLVPASFGLIWVSCAYFHSVRSSLIMRPILLGAMTIDLLAYSLTPSVGYADTTFVMSTHMRPEMLQNVPAETRLFHRWEITNTVHQWQLRSLDDWAVFKGMLVPSIGAAYGLSEVESRSQLISRRHVAFLIRLNLQMTRTLLAEARVSRIITLASGAALKPMPEKNDVHVIENLDLKPRFWMDTGSAVEVRKDEPGLFLCEAQGPGQLIVSESFFPGWKVFSDGKPITAEPFDQTFLSASVPAGRHSISFKYRPVSFYGGATVSIATLAVLLIVCVF